MLGPGLGPGSLLNLDLVATEHWPGPRSFWGLGPELGRGLPFELGVSAVAWATSGSTAVKTFYLAAVTTAFVCMHVQAGRLGLDPTERLGAALIYAGSPFLATRMGVGHLTMVAAIAILPWAHRQLIDQRDVRSVTIAAAALAIAGFYGGLLAGVALLAGSIGRPFRRSARLWAYALAAQLVWLAPGVALLVRGTDLGGGENFPSGLSTWDAPLRLITGHGFWQSRFQVGGSTVTVVVVGALIAALAVMGIRAMRGDWTRRSLAAGTGAALVILLDAAPGIDGGVDTLTRLPVLSALREPHRLAPLVLLPVAIWVPVGVRSLTRAVPADWKPASRLVPIALAAVLLAPAVWGLDGQLDPVETPDGWHEARAIIADRPGPAVLLPWHRYLNVSFAEERRVLHPGLQFFGPDVVASTDLELGQPTREAIEPRERAVAELLPSIPDGRPIGDQLARIGIRWVILTHDADYQELLGLLDDVQLTSVLADRDIDLFEVNAWRGELVGGDQSPRDLRRLGSPLAIADASDPGRWGEPWMEGWMQGFRPLHRSDSGTILVSEGSQMLWHWPSLFVITGYLLWAFVILRVGRWAQPDEQPTEGGSGDLRSSEVGVRLPQVPDG
jgi:hypothetical protein